MFKLPDDGWQWHQLDHMVGQQQGHPAVSGEVLAWLSVRFLRKVVVFQLLVFKVLVFSLPIPKWHTCYFHTFSGLYNITE